MLHFAQKVNFKQTRSEIIVFFDWPDDRSLTKSERCFGVFANRQIFPLAEEHSVSKVFLRSVGDNAMKHWATTATGRWTKRYPVAIQIYFPNGGSLVSGTVGRKIKPNSNYT